MRFNLLVKGADFIQNGAWGGCQQNPSWNTLISSRGIRAVCQNRQWAQCSYWRDSKHWSLKFYWNQTSMKVAGKSSQWKLERQIHDNFLSTTSKSHARVYIPESFESQIVRDDFNWREMQCNQNQNLSGLPEKRFPNNIAVLSSWIKWD